MGRRRDLTTVLIVGLLLVGRDPAAGQGVREVRLAFDNDGLNVWIPPSRRSDWFYTHGTHLDAVVDRHALARLAPGGGALAPCDGGTHPCVLTRVGLSQEIYTPRNLFFFTPDEGDRPYAGWLAATLAVERVAPDRSTTVTLELGVTGSPSLAREVHLAIHRWLDKAEPRGWEHQIPFELAGAVSLREAWRWSPVRSDVGASGSLEAHWSGTLGTLRTSGEAGVSLRLGWNAPPGDGWAGSTEGAWLLAVVGAEGEMVVRDLFLDGSAWHEGDQTVREPLLTRRKLRLLAGWRSVALELGVTTTSPAFHRQIDPHTYTSVGIRVRK